MTVSELDRTMPATELMEWQQLASIDPLPDYWLGVAKICATLINVNRAKGKPVKPEEVLPFLKGPTKKQSSEATVNELKDWLS